MTVWATTIRYLKARSLGLGLKSQERSQIPRILGWFEDLRTADARARIVESKLVAVIA